VCIVVHGVAVGSDKLGVDGALFQSNSGGLGNVLVVLWLDPRPYVSFLLLLVAWRRV